MSSHKKPSHIIDAVIDSAVQFFKTHYESRLGPVTVEKPAVEHFDHTVVLNHPYLKHDNGPRIFHHGGKTDDVIVLTHGFTDSPYYLQAVARSFYLAGANVVMPLLPAHGLKNPGERL